MMTRMLRIRGVGTVRPGSLAACCWALLASGLAAQEPVPAPKPVPAPTPTPAPPPPDPAQVARAQALLDLHQRTSAGVRVLVADYVQRRTTALAKEPLQSEGEFLFVREPGVVMFRASVPRQSITRLTTATYEVHRPQKRQLERFHLDGPELAAGLFAALGGDAARLRADFDVVACRDDAAGGDRVRIQLVPKAAAVRERLRELEIVLQGKDARLCAVAYRDGSGDRIEIELRAVRVDPVPTPKAELELTADTVVVEHRPGAGGRR